MADFSGRVTALSGSVSDATELGTWLTDGAVDVIRRLALSQPEVLIRAASTYNIGTSGGTLGTAAFILDVYRGTYSCEEIVPGMRFKYNDSSSLFKATTKHPVYYRLNNRITVLPQPSASQAYASIVAPPTVASTDSVIATFPNDIEYLVVLYAACQNLQAKMTDLTLPADVVLPVVPMLDSFVTLTQSLPTYSAVGAFVLPAIPASANIDFSGIGSTPSFTAPNAIVLPTLSLGADLSLSAFSQTTTAPTPPVITLSDGSVAAFTTAPSFIAPALTFTSTATLASLTLPVCVLPTAPSITDASIAGIPQPVPPPDPSFTTPNISLPATLPTYTMPVSLLNLTTALGTITTQVETTEDIELAQGKLAQVAQAVNVLNVDIQNELHNFNQKNTVYQAQVQEAIRECELLTTVESQEYAALLNKYQAEAQVYVALVNAEVQKFALNQTQKQIEVWKVNVEAELSKYQTSVNAEIQKWNSEQIQGAQGKWIAARQSEIAEYSGKLQSALQDFNAGNVSYQADIQHKIQEATNLLESDRAKVQGELQKYSQQLQQYQVDVNTEFQEYLQKDIAAELTEWTTKRANLLEEFGRNSANTLQKHAQELQQQVQDYTTDFQAWSQLIQKAAQTYQLETGYDLSLFRSELEAQSARHTADLQNEQQEFAAGINKYQADLQYVTSTNQDYLNKYAQKIGIYGAEANNAIQQFNAILNKRNMNYQWYVDQYNRLKTQYEQGFMVRGKQNG